MDDPVNVEMDLRPIIGRMIRNGIDELVLDASRDHKLSHARSVKASFWATIAYGVSVPPGVLALANAWDHQLTLMIVDAAVAVSNIIVAVLFSRRFYRAIADSARATGRIAGARTLIDIFLSKEPKP